MNAIEMLIKSVGLDPDAIKKQVNDVQNIAHNYDARMARVEKLLELISMKLSIITPPEIPATNPLEKINGKHA